jgi:hypothetical protein
MTRAVWNGLPTLPCAPCLKTSSRAIRVAVIFALIFCMLRPLYAAQPTTDALGLLKVAVQTELDADANDHSRWRYRDDQRDLGTVSIVVQTDDGAVKRLIERGGQPLSPADASAEDARIERFIHDPSRLAKQRRDGEQDDKSARELLTMLPDAFKWTVESENAAAIKLHFEPRPDFRPPSLQSKVLSAMNGVLVIDRAQHRIMTISGRLTQDVVFGFGFLGRLRQGGTFRVERRQILPGLWQITETHVHIDGKALLFKSIGQQQDELQTEYTRVPGGTTLEQAAAMSRP